MNDLRSIISVCWLLASIAACKAPEQVVADNLLGGKILTVVHGCGGFPIYRNTTPPNTQAALRKTLLEEPDGIEMDVQLSADGALVVFHDGMLESSTDCAGCVGLKDWAEIQDCAYRTRYGQLDGIHRLPLLDTMLAMIASSGTRPYVFINTKHDSPCDPGNDPVFMRSFAEKVAAAVQRHGLGDRVLIESMNADFLDIMHDVDGSLTLLFDDEDYVRGMKVVQEHHFIGLCISNGIVTQAQVQAAHAEGYWLGIWGVRVLGDTRNAVEKGPELIMTDDLMMLRAALKK